MVKVEIRNTVEVDEKLVAAILYMLRACSPARPGLTSLVKMLWYADYWHYRENLAPITGASYVALPEGPVINQYRNLFEKLVEERYLEREEIPIQGKHPKQEYRPLMDPDEDLFSESELAILDRVVTELGRLPGFMLSRMTHSEGPWPFVWDPSHSGRPIPHILFRWLDNLPGEDDLEEAQRELSGRPNVVEAIRELEKAPTT